MASYQGLQSSRFYIPLSPADFITSTGNRLRMEIWYFKTATVNSYEIPIFRVNTVVCLHWPMRRLNLHISKVSMEKNRKFYDANIYGKRLYSSHSRVLTLFVNDSKTSNLFDQHVNKCFDSLQQKGVPLREAIFSFFVPLRKHAYSNIENFITKKMKIFR